MLRIIVLLFVAVAVLIHTGECQLFPRYGTLDQAVQYIIHPNARPSLPMIELALNHLIMPRQRSQLKEFIPHFVQLALDMGIQTNDTKGNNTKHYNNLYNMIHQKSMLWLLSKIRQKVNVHSQPQESFLQNLISQKIMQQVGQSQATVNIEDLYEMLGLDYNIPNKPSSVGGLDSASQSHFSNMNMGRLFYDIGLNMANSVMDRQSGTGGAYTGKQFLKGEGDTEGAMSMSGANNGWQFPMGGANTEGMVAVNGANMGWQFPMGGANTEGTVAVDGANMGWQFPMGGANTEGTVAVDGANMGWQFPMGGANTEGTVAVDGANMGWQFPMGGANTEGTVAVDGANMGWQFPIGGANTEGTVAVSGANMGWQFPMNDINMGWQFPRSNIVGQFPIGGADMDGPMAAANELDLNIAHILPIGAHLGDPTLDYVYQGQPMGKVTTGMPFVTSGAQIASPSTDTKTSVVEHGINLETPVNNDNTVLQ